MRLKTLMLTAGAVTVVGAVAVAAVAHEGGSYARHGGHDGGYHNDGGWGHKGRGMQRLQMLKKLDENGDGSVTLEEYLKPKADRFAELDADGKGGLDGEALVKRESAQLEYRIKRMLKRYDANGDGQISKAEFEEPARARFAKRDFNGDGKIEGDELPPQHKKYLRGGDDADDDRGDDGKDEGGDDRDRSARRDDGERGHRHWHHRRHDHHRKHHGGRGWHDEPRSLEDVLKRVGRRFGRRDSNSDGVIDRDEIAGVRGEKIAFKQRARMHVLDTNKDGTVSREEFLAGRQTRFSMIDLNGDGKIDAQDLSPRAARHWDRKAGGKQDQ